MPELRQGLFAAVLGMSSLQRLSLEGNRLTSLPKEVGDLAGLRVLNVNSNLLTAIPGSCLPQALLGSQLAGQGREAAPVSCLSSRSCLPIEQHAVACGQDGHTTAARSGTAAQLACAGGGTACLCCT